MRANFGKAGHGRRAGGCSEFTTEQGLNRKHHYIYPAVQAVSQSGLAKNIINWFVIYYYQQIINLISFPHLCRAVSLKTCVLWDLNAAVC